MVSTTKTQNVKEKLRDLWQKHSTYFSILFFENIRVTWYNGRGMNIYYKFEKQVTISLFIFINRDVSAYLEMTINQIDLEFLFSR